MHFQINLLAFPKKKKNFFLYIIRFQSSVMCVDFAKRTPNLLAAGFLNGDLLILDITTTEKKVCVQNNLFIFNNLRIINFIFNL